MRGLWHHTGENHGTPFQISTIASYGPMRCSSSLAITRGNTV